MVILYVPEQGPMGLSVGWSLYLVKKLKFSTAKKKRQMLNVCILHFGSLQTGINSVFFFLFYLCFPTWLIKCFNVTNLNTFSIFLDIVHAPWRVHLTEGFYLVQLLMHNVQCAICKQHKAHAFPFCLTGQILLQLNVPCTALCRGLGSLLLSAQGQTAQQLF